MAQQLQNNASVQPVGQQTIDQESAVVEDETNDETLLVPNLSKDTRKRAAKAKDKKKGQPKTTTKEKKVHAKKDPSKNVKTLADKYKSQDNHGKPGGGSGAGKSNLKV